MRLFKTLVDFERGSCLAYYVEAETPQDADRAVTFFTRDQYPINVTVFQVPTAPHGERVLNLWVDEQNIWL